jgi:hypothetical protein
LLSYLTETLYVPFPLPAKYPAHIICTDFFTELLLMVGGADYEILHYEKFAPVPLYLIFLGNFLSGSGSSLNFRKQFSNPYKTTERFSSVI